MHATPHTADRRRNLPMAALVVAMAAACMTALVPVAPAHAAEAGVTTEASRQLDFARAELEAGEYDRAVKSAGSALRLDPGLFEAMMVKGLALEGTGDKVLAEALLRTYIELLGSEKAQPQAKAALARLTGVPLEQVAPDAGSPELAVLADSDRG